MQAALFVFKINEYFLSKYANCGKKRFLDRDPKIKFCKEHFLELVEIVRVKFLN